MQSQRPALKQSFGFWTGWFLVVACMVGSGILTTSGIILQNTGSYLALTALWFVGGLIALCGALTLGELASGMPRVGGDYTFVREAFGPEVGFVYGWSTILLGFAAPVALIAYTTSLYLQPAAVHWLEGTAWLSFVSGKSFLYSLSSFLIVLFTTLHCLGQEESSRVQGATTIFKLAVLFVLIGVALFSPESRWENLWQSSTKVHGNFSIFASSLILVMYAYTGWNAAAYLAGEIRNSPRTVPRCLAFGCLSVALLYLVVNIVYGLALSPEQVIALSPDAASRICDSVANIFFGARGASTFSLLVSLGVVASLSAYILTGPRVVFAMAHDRLLPGWFGQVSERAQVPVRATLFQGGLSLLLLWSGTFQELLDFTGYGLAALAMLVVAPIFVMRRRRDFEPAFRVPLYPWLPGLFLVLSVAMLVGGAMETPKLALLSLASILVGFPLYRLWHRFKAVPGIAKTKNLSPRSNPR